MGGKLSSRPMTILAGSAGAAAAGGAAGSVAAGAGVSVLPQPHSRAVAAALASSRRRDGVRNGFMDKLVERNRRPARRGTLRENP